MFAADAMMASERARALTTGFPWYLTRQRQKTETIKKKKQNKKKRIWKVTSHDDYHAFEFLSCIYNDLNGSITLRSLGPLHFAGHAKHTIECECIYRNDGRLREIHWRRANYAIWSRPPDRICNNIISMWPLALAPHRMAAAADCAEQGNTFAINRSDIPDDSFAPNFSTIFQQINEPAFVSATRCSHSLLLSFALHAFLSKPATSAWTVPFFQ